MSLRRRSLFAIVWNSAGGMINMVISFIISVILSRILGPSEYGLLAIAMSFIALSQGMVELGFHTSIIRHKEIRDIDLSSIFVLNLLLGAAFTLLFYLCAPYIAQWYGKQELSPIIQALSFIFVLNGVSLVHRANLERKLDFKWLNIARITALIISGFIGISMAYQGYGIWSLVVFNLGISLISSIIIWLKSGWRPSLRWSKEVIKEHWSFSFNVFAANLITTITHRLDVLLLGRFQTTATLGLFNRGKSLNDLGTRIPGQFVLRPLFSSLSKIQADEANMREKLQGIYRLLSLMFIPVFAFGIAFAPEIIRFLYGEKWLGTVPFLRVFLMIGILHIMRIPNNYILLARGQSGKVFRLELGLNLLRILLIVLIAPVDIMYLLQAFFLLKIIEYFVYIRAVSQEIQSDAWHLTRIWGEYLLVSILILAPLRWGVIRLDSLILRLIPGFILFFGLYFSFHYFTQSKGWNLLKVYLSEFKGSLS